MNEIFYLGGVYRTNVDASVVERKNGNSWSRSYSLGVRRAALDAMARKCGDGCNGCAYCLSDSTDKETATA